MKTLCSLVLLVIGMSLHGSDARACSIPCGAWLWPKGGTVPANLKAISYTEQGHGGPTPELVVTEVLADGTELEVPLEPDLSFGRALVPGATYHVGYRAGLDRCGYPDAGVTFVAGPEAPLPTKLGTIVVDPPSYGDRHVFYNTSPACFPNGEAATRKARLALEPEALPWVDAMEVGWAVATIYPFHTSDGPIDTGWQHAQRDIEVYRACSDTLPGGLAAGANTLTVIARFPGEEATITTSTEIDIACRGEGEGCATAPTSMLALVGLAGIGLRRARTARRH